jgi:hypothetical protein
MTIGRERSTRAWFLRPVDWAEAVVGSIAIAALLLCKIAVTDWQHHAPRKYNLFAWAFGLVVVPPALCWLAWQWLRKLPARLWPYGRHRTAPSDDVERPMPPEEG